MKFFARKVSLIHYMFIWMSEKGKRTLTLDEIYKEYLSGWNVPTRIKVTKNEIKTTLDVFHDSGHLFVSRIEREGEETRYMLQSMSGRFQERTPNLDNRLYPLEIEQGKIRFGRTASQG